MATKTDTKRQLTAAEKAEVGKLIEQSSIEAVAKQIDINPTTLRTVAGGLPGQKGTLRMIRDWLATRANGAEK